MSRTNQPRHCQNCGGELMALLPDSQGGAPYYCSRCGQPVYLDPKLAVACVVEAQGGLVLLRRAQHDPAYGRWILPGGHVDRGEEVPRAARREVSEETGLDVELEGLLGVYSYQGNPTVLVVYAARQTGGMLRGGGEALEIRTFPPEQLPWDELGYRSTGEALRDYLQRFPQAGRALCPAPGCVK